MNSLYDLLIELGKTWPSILLTMTILGTLVTVGSAYVLITPKKTDDKWWQRLEEHKIFGVILRLLKRFSVLQRKGTK